MMNIWIAMLLITAAGIGGLFLGTFLAKKSQEQQLEDVLVMDVTGLRSIMASMGQKPNEAKVQQVYRQLKQSQKAAGKKSKKK